MSINLPKLFDSGKRNVIFFDPSGSHLAYVISSMDLTTKELIVWNAGMVWTPASFDKGERLTYMQTCIDLLINWPLYPQFIPDAVVTEQFFQNPKLITGSTAVIPTVNHFIEMAATVGNTKYMELGPTTWRSILGIKPDRDKNGKKEYKEPAKRYVELFTKLPEKIPSNVDSRMRNLPNDLTDALCLGLAVARYHGCDTVSFANAWDYPIGYIRRFSQLTKGTK